MWLIDHGASLCRHHAWDGGAVGPGGKFPMVKVHVLLPWADAIAEAGARLARASDRHRDRAAICAGAPEAGPIARLPPSERFHWIVAPRNTIIQPSAVHAGLTDDPKATLRELLDGPSDERGSCAAQLRAAPWVVQSGHARRPLSFDRGAPFEQPPAVAANHGGIRRTRFQVRADV